jgi:chromosome segregation ATPase
VNVQTWAAILTAAGIGGIVVEVVRAILHRRGMDASTAKEMSEAAVLLVSPLKDRVSELESELTATEARASELDKDLKEATATVVTLTTQIVNLTNELMACRSELAELRRELGPHHTD